MEQDIDLNIKRVNSEACFLISRPPLFLASVESEEPSATPPPSASGGGKTPVVSEQRCLSAGADFEKTHLHSN